MYGGSSCCAAKVRTLLILPQRQSSLISTQYYTTPFYLLQALLVRFFLCITSPHRKNLFGTRKRERQTSGTIPKRLPIPYSSSFRQTVLNNQLLPGLTESLSSTSCAPPSTIETEDTSVSRAFSRSCSIVSAPQLHMVERILASVVSTPSANAPA